MQTAGDIREAAAPIAHVAGDPRAGFGQFTLIRDLYQYDPVPLDAKIEATDEGSPYWKKQTVSFAGPSGAGRISAFFFIPKNASPPYQTVV